MKKFLALVLALVMTMSLVTISAGAEDFTDADSITYEEAVDVMTAVGVVGGYADGSFNPTAGLTRGAAAKIICNMILGPTTAEALVANDAPYSDVAVDNVFAGYIAYCANEGIISGYADGTFRPAAPLTGYAFMKMLLGALGYDTAIEGYTGANWSIQVAKQALAIELDKGLKGDFAGTMALTREEACLYAFNALNSEMVSYPNNTAIVVGDITVTTTSTAKGTDDLFREVYFEDLEVEHVHAVYGRPANKWINDDETVGTYVSAEPSFVYTAGTKEKDVYADLSSAMINGEWTVWVDGDDVAEASGLAKTVTTNWEYTANGAVTEIYAQKDEDGVTVVDVVVINNYIGEVVRVKTDDDGEYAVVKGLKKGTTPDVTKIYAEGYEVGDLVVYTVDVNDDDETYVASIVAPETVTGTVERVQKYENSSDTYIRVDGAKYTYSAWTVYDLEETTAAHPALAEEYNLYVDENGYVLAFELVSEETATEYLYVIDSWKEYGEWSAKVLLADGTVTRVDVDSKLADDTTAIAWLDVTGDSDGKSNIDGYVWSYTVDDDKVYTLDAVTAVYPVALADIENGDAYVTFTADATKNFIVDDETVFVDYDNETAYVGYNEVINIENASVIYVLDGKVAEIVFVLSGDVYDVDGTYFMLAEKDIEDIETTKHDKKYYRIFFDAYVNGEQVEELLIEKSVADTLDAGVLYKVTKTVDEIYVIAVDTVSIDNAGYVAAVGANAFYLNGSTAAADKYTVNSATNYVVVEAQYDEDGAYESMDIELGSLSDMKVSDADAADGWVVYVEVVKADEQKAELVYIYRYMLDGDAVVAEDAGYYWTSETKLYVCATLTTDVAPLAEGALVYALVDADGNIIAEAVNNVEVSVAGEEYGCSFQAAARVTDYWEIDGVELSEVAGLQVFAYGDLIAEAVVNAENIL